MADDYVEVETEDDFYDLGSNVTDDYWRYKDGYNNPVTNDDDDDTTNYDSSEMVSWLDKLLNDTSATQDGNSLQPVEDVNPDNVLAALIFNSIVCVMLLGLYEVLRRWIPSVYSQRLMHERQSYHNNGTTSEDSRRRLVDKQMEQQFVQTSNMKASGRSLRELSVGGSVMGTVKSDEKEETTVEVVGEAGEENGTNQTNTHQQQEDEDDIPSHKIRGYAFPILEWCIPVHSTPWSTFRHLAGLDAYFFLRYIRMCFKITAVSSFWAIIILCPVYATGGGDQSGFYHFSMANVLQDDLGRVWVPTFFCWAFTMYCWFCVKEEMMHYVELRAEFLGGEEEEGILRRKGSMSGGHYGAPLPTENGEHDQEGEVATTTNNGEDEGELSPSIGEKRSRSRSPLLGDQLAADNGNNSTVTAPISPLQSTVTQYVAHQKQIMKQHRYSLQVEKVPPQLRSNTALFNYFNEIFPNQVHSACIAMNCPELDEFSVRRDRVCRRLEKSLEYYNVTHTRPTHIAGRPRFRCCGIESTPIDGLCLACCCCYDSSQMETYNVEDGEVYAVLPDKGECVDSIQYYTRDLANCNFKMKVLQAEKFRIAETGNSPRRKIEGPLGQGLMDESNCDWYSQPLGMLKTGAAAAAEGLREEFEVSGEEDYLGDSVTSAVPRYGAMSSSSYAGPLAKGSKRKSSPEMKRARLVDNDRLVDLDDQIDSSSVSLDGVELPQQVQSTKQKRRFLKPHTWLRTLLWRMGVDFLAAGLDEVRSRTDVVVDSVTRPSMSSTGFVTFKTLTPVTVTTSAPLTYNRNPMEVSIAPETRDFVWQNVQIDRDIGASRAFVANVLLGLGVLLWSIPLTLIQAWAKVETVALIPGFEWIGQIHGGQLKPLINGYLPVVTLLGLILLLPLVFQWVATSYEKRKTQSGVQNSIVGRYFYYQLANIYITVTAGALWTSLAVIIDHPQKLLMILGETLPKLAGYFISLLLTKTLAGLPMVLLRIGALSRMMFLRSCFNKKRLTQRELREVYRKQPIYYGWEYPTQFLVIIICFTYACITPFILPVGALYYCVALLVYKKQALYVYTPTYESGGRMFPQAVSKTLFALLISQLTFIGYTLIRKGVFQIILLAPLPFLTVFFTMFINHRYVEPSKKLSLERAVKIDSLSDQSPYFSEEAYQQPVLTEKALVPECANSDDVLQEVLANLQRLELETAEVLA